MIPKGRAVQAAVVELLMSTADRIVVLFERTFAEYQEEVVRSKLLQQPRVVLHRGDIQTDTVGAGNDPEAIKIKLEEELTFQIPLSSPKARENVTKSTLREDAAKRRRRGSVGKRREAGTADRGVNGPPPTDRSGSLQDPEPRATPADGHDSGRSAAAEGGARSGHSPPQRPALASSTYRPLYRCFACGRRFTQQKTLRRHVRCTHFKERPHTCSVCQKGFFRKYDYDIHFRIHSGERPFSCSVCDKSYRSKKSLNDHRCSQGRFQDAGPVRPDRPHSQDGPEGPGGPVWGGSVPSAFERKQFDSWSASSGTNVDPGPIQIKKEDDLKLPLCSEETKANINKSATKKKRKSRLVSTGEEEEDEPREDIQTVIVGEEANPGTIKNHKEEDLPSELPSSSGKSEGNVSHDAGEDAEPGCSADSDLRDRQDVCSDTDHSSDWELDTQNGPEAKKSRSKISADVALNHGPNRCDHCSKSFNSQTMLTKHLRLHSGQAVFTCPVCGRVYTHKKHYKAHLQVHANPYQCPFCQRVFSKRYGLNEHMSIHTGEKPFSCSICGMRFRGRKMREAHFYNVHDIQKPYTCPVCQRGFIRRYLFESHMRIHTGERPFRCTFCDKGFNAKKSLKNHMKYHQVDQG